MRLVILAVKMSVDKWKLFIYSSHIMSADNGLGRSYRFTPETAKTLGIDNPSVPIVDIRSVEKPFTLLTQALQTGDVAVAIPVSDTPLRPEGSFRPGQIWTKPDGTTHDPHDNEVYP
jgi:hypothetical protein